MKQNLLILFICGGLLATGPWEYGYTPNSGPDSRRRAISSNSIEDFAMCAWYIQKFRATLSNAHPLMRFSDEEIKSICADHKKHCGEDLKEIFEHCGEDIKAILNGNSFSKTPENFGKDLQKTLRPYAIEINERLNTMEAMQNTSQQCIPKEIRIVDDLQSAYIYYKIAADLKILFQFYPGMYLALDPLDPQLSFPCLRELNPMKMKQFIVGFRQILGECDQSQFSQYLSAIEAAFAQISLDYNPDNFDQVMAKLQSLRTSTR
jgi:hypothetical protein